MTATEALKALSLALWTGVIEFVKSWTTSGFSLPKTWNQWAVVAVLAFGLLWYLDKVPSTKQLSEVPRPVLTSEVSDLATKQEVLVNLKQMVMAYETLQARVESLEAAAVKPKVKR